MIDFIIRFVKDNPLMVVLVVMLCVFAPSLLGGMLIGLLILVGLLLLLPIIMYFRLRRISKRMEQQTHQHYQNNQRQAHNQREGEIKVYTTTERPKKRVNDSVGDYVDFEEIKKPQDEK